MGNLKRRDFLKTMSAAVAVPTVMRATPTSRRRSKTLTAAESLPDVPNVESMQSVVMTHKFGDHFNPPGLTNQWGCAQAAVDVTAIRSIAFPPYAQGEMNVAPLGAGGELMTGVLYIDGDYFASTKTPIEFIWQPDQIRRRSVYKGLELSSITIVPFQTMSTAVKLTVKNITGQKRSTEIKLAINGGATKSVQLWNAAYSPGEYDNDRTVELERNAVLCKSKRTDAFVLQGAFPKAAKLLQSWLVYNFDLAPGESRS